MRFQDAVNAVLNSKDKSAHADAMALGRLFIRIEKTEDGLKISGPEADDLYNWEYELIENLPITFDEAMIELLINRKRVKNVDWCRDTYLMPNVVGGFDFSEAAHLKKVFASGMDEDWMVIE